MQGVVFYLSSVTADDDTCPACDDMAIRADQLTVRVYCKRDFGNLPFLSFDCETYIMDDHGAAKFFL